MDFSTSSFLVADYHISEIADTMSDRLSEDNYGMIHSKKEGEWLDKPLREIDTVIDEFVTQHDMFLEKNEKGWISRKLFWEVQDKIVCSISIQRKNKVEEKFNVEIDAVKDYADADGCHRKGKWKSIRNSITSKELQENIEEILKEAYKIASSWSEEDLKVLNDNEESEKIEKTREEILRELFVGREEALAVLAEVESIIGSFAREHNLSVRDDLPDIPIRILDWDVSDGISRSIQIDGEARKRDRVFSVQVTAIKMDIQGEIMEMRHSVIDEAVPHERFSQEIGSILKRAYDMVESWGGEPLEWYERIREKEDNS